MVMSNPSSKRPWKAKVITLFPELFPGPLGCSLAGKALRDHLWQLETIDLRPFGTGRHQTVDERPTGGGPGMVFRPDVVASALESAADETPSDRDLWPIVYLSPRGIPLHQSHVETWATGQGITLLCGRFEGVDERVIHHFGLTEISLGDYILSGGEIAAFALIDAVIRLIPEVLGNSASTIEESHTSKLLEYPQYTHPRVWRGIEVPQILFSGNHAEIAQWRKSQARCATRRRRPDLWQAYCGQDNKAVDGKSDN